MDTTNQRETRPEEGAQRDGAAAAGVVDEQVEHGQHQQRDAGEVAAHPPAHVVPSLEAALGTGGVQVRHHAAPMFATWSTAEACKQTVFYMKSFTCDSLGKCSSGTRYRQLYAF